MNRRLLAVSAAILLSSAVSGLAVADAAPDLRDTLRQRYIVSHIEVQNTPTEGVVVKQGTVLTLRGGAVPARRARYVQANTKSPRFHVHDYARVEIANGRADIAGPSDFMLPTGTRLVILGLKVDRDAIRLFTHTARPVATADGKPVYGCTEFVFRVDPDVVRGSDPAPAQRAIEQWLTVA